MNGHESHEKTMNIVLSSIGALKNPKESARITLLLLAKELQQRGHEVRIIAKGSEPEQIQEMTIYKTPLLRLPWLLHKMNQKKKIDIIHSFSSSPLFLVPHLFASGKKVHTLKSYSRSRLGRIGYGILRLAHAVTVPTHYFASRLPFRKKVHVIRSPIDTSKFYAHTRKTGTERGVKRRMEREVELGEEKKGSGEKVVLYYGAMTHNKGAKVLLQSIPYVLKESAEIRFLFYPRHSQIKEWTDLAKKLHLENHCKFIMDDVDIAEYVRSADLVALPYINLQGTDGNPSCLLEVMACGIPVVTSDLPELREIAEGAVEFVPAGDHKKLAEKIMQIIRCPDQDKIKKGIKVSGQFAAAIVAKEMEDIYAGILSSQEAGAKRFFRTFFSSKRSCYTLAYIRCF